MMKNASYTRQELERTREYLHSLIDEAVDSIEIQDCRVDSFYVNTKPQEGDTYINRELTGVRELRLRWQADYR